MVLSMLSKRRKSINPYLMALASWPTVSYRQPVGPQAISMLIVCYVIQLESNRLVARNEICKRTGASPNNVTLLMKMLIDAGMAERVESLGMYNVTESGEYFLRGLVASIARIASESKNSRWERANRHFRKSTRWKNKSNTPLDYGS